MKTLYLEQVGGASGDMFLGALVSLGVDPRELNAGLGRLGVPGLRVESREVERHGLRAVHVTVHADEIPPSGGPSHPVHEHGHEHEHGHDHGSRARPEPHTHRSYTEIVAMIRRSKLPAEVVDRSVAVFTRLGEAEALEHGVSLDAVHFHEVGAADSIADIVGVCLGLRILGVERLVSSPFLFGRGRAEMAHGSWPVPAPATVRLALGHPVQFSALEGETVTPTGAALIVTLADAVGDSPALALERIGTGAGSRDWPDRPNVLRAFLGTVSPGGFCADEIEVLTTTIDDATPEVIGGLTETLLASGALDVVIMPVQMKKGRPGFRVEVLAPPALGEALAARLLTETPTIGVRHRREGRWVLNRRPGTVQLSWGPVAVKIVELPDGSRRVTPEFEDCRRISRESGIPLIEVMRLAGESEVAED